MCSLLLGCVCVFWWRRWNQSNQELIWFWDLFLLELTPVRHRFPAHLAILCVPDWTSLAAFLSICYILILKFPLKFHSVPQKTLLWPVTQQVGGGEENREAFSVILMKPSDRSTLFLGLHDWNPLNDPVQPSGVDLNHPHMVFLFFPFPLSKFS